MPPDRENRPAPKHQTASLTTRIDGTDFSSGSRQVSWWSVHEYVQPVLDRVGIHPMIGTPEWCALPDDDKRKLAAVFDAAQHWALRVETSQQQHADASHEVSAAADWKAIANEITARQRAIASGAYIPRTAVS